MTLPRTPDGECYWQMAAGERQPLPYHLRWLVPRLCGTDDRRWRVVLLASLALCCVGAALYARTPWAALMPLGLAGLTVCASCVLVDLPAHALALAAAVLCRYSAPAAVVLALAGGATNERAPIFAAAWAWSPWPLIGLAAPALRMLVRPAPAPTEGLVATAVRHPLRAAWAAHRPLGVGLYVLPWGAALLGLAHPSVQLYVVLALAYGQLLVATDLARLYVWAWPVLVAGAFDAVPHSWAALLVVAHLANPHRGTGW